jgi:hypothetical protein
MYVSPCALTGRRLAQSPACTCLLMYSSTCTQLQCTIISYLIELSSDFHFDCSLYKGLKKGRATIHTSAVCEEVPQFRNVPNARTIQGKLAVKAQAAIAHRAEYSRQWIGDASGTAPEMCKRCPIHYTHEIL